MPRAEAHASLDGTQPLRFALDAAQQGLTFGSRSGLAESCAARKRGAAATSGGVLGRSLSYPDDYEWIPSVQKRMRSRQAKALVVVGGLEVRAHAFVDQLGVAVADGLEH